MMVSLASLNWAVNKKPHRGLPPQMDGIMIFFFFFFANDVFALKLYTFNK